MNTSIIEGELDVVLAAETSISERKKAVQNQK